MHKLKTSASLIGLAIGLLTAAPNAAAAKPSPDVVAVKPLIKDLHLPYQRFTLQNGLRVLVHTDRKAPVVAVSVWYDVGSKHEPQGKTGFAHLFEHLMFNGSENADGDWFEPMAQIGATALNGTTWFDRTNYFETVPTGALERTLYLESDRMGHLLGAVTQEKLTNQIGVVQNEKRQGDNKPYGLVDYAQTEALFDKRHPYGHSTIGSMADLSAASLDDVKQWFRDHYGPNNAVIVLAGDIDLPTAKILMTRYFGHIKAGPATRPVSAPIPTLAARKDIILKDRVPTTRIERTWIVPGLNDKDNVPLSMGAAVLGGLASSRLDNILVRDEQLAVSVSANLQTFAQLGFFSAQANVKPGVDPALVSRRLDEIINELIDKGPATQELKRVVVKETLGTVSGLETAGGKASTLAEGELYSRKPTRFATDLSVMAAATPAQVQVAMAKWLKRPPLALSVVPGARDAYVEAPAALVHKAAAKPSAPEQRIAREAAPGVGQLSELAFPDVARATLSNGIEIIYAQRKSVPLTQVAVSFDAGLAADPDGKVGLSQLTTALLKEGTQNLSSRQIAEREEELGASIAPGASMDRSGVSMTSLSSSLAPALDLMSEIVRRPAFAEADIERTRARQLAKIEADMTDPAGMAARVLAPALFGSTSPYGVNGVGVGTKASVEKLSRADIQAFHSAWFRPEKAKIFVVSDRPLSEIQSLVESRFGQWRGEGQAGEKSFGAGISEQPGILLVDRKDSPQSLILAAQVLGVDPKQELLALEAANEAIGGGFLSRNNMDLRETKGWSYGVRAGLGRRERAVAYQVQAPVQADKTGESIKALLHNYREFLSAKGVTPAELERTINNGVRELPGAFETSKAVMQALQTNDFFKRPDDYYEKLPAEYRSLTQADVDSAARSTIDPAKFIWVIVGDADKVRPQLDALGLPVKQVNIN